MRIGRYLYGVYAVALTWAGSRVQREWFFVVSYVCCSFHVVMLMNGDAIGVVGVWYTNDAMEFWS